jgi:hypothetical protein
VRNGVRHAVTITKNQPQVAIGLSVAWRDQAGSGSEYIAITVVPIMAGALGGPDGNSARVGK